MKVYTLTWDNNAYYSEDKESEFLGVFLSYEKAEAAIQKDIKRQKYTSRYASDYDIDELELDKLLNYIIDKIYYIAQKCKCTHDCVYNIVKTQYKRFLSLVYKNFKLCLKN